MSGVELMLTAVALVLMVLAVQQAAAILGQRAQHASLAASWRAVSDANALAFSQTLVQLHDRKQQVQPELVTDVEFAYGKNG